MQDAKDKKPATRRFWRRRVLLSLAFVATLAVVGGYLVLGRLTAPDNIRSKALAELGSMVNGRVDIGDCGFSWSGGIRLSNVAVYEAEKDHNVQSNRPVIELPFVEISHEFWPLLAGKLRLRSVKVHEPVIRIVHHTGQPATSVTGLYKGVNDGGAAALPSVELNDLKIVVRETDAKHSRIVEEVVLSVRGVPSPNNKSLYELAWNRTRDRVSSGRAVWNLDDGSLRNIRNGLPWLSLEAVTLGIASQIRDDTQWHTLLGLDGDVRIADYDLSFSDEPARPAFFDIQWQDAALSLPYDDEDRTRPPDDRYLRFTNVNGRATVRPESLDASFTGRLHGAECNVQASFLAGMRQGKALTLQSVGYRVKAEIKDFTLPSNHEGFPREREFVQDLKPLEIFYRNYEPSGRVDAELIIEKDSGADKQVRLVRLALDGKGATLRNKHFPYRVHDVYGRVEFLPEGIFMRNITTRHGDAELTVNGFVNRPKPWTGADLTITGHNVSLDDELLDALPPRFQQGIRTIGAQGTVDVFGKLERDDGTENNSHPWKAFLQTDFVDLSVCYDEFPLRFDGFDGTVLLDETTVQIVDARSHVSGREVTIAGTYNFPRSGKSYSLAIESQHLTIDRNLVEQLPPTLGSGLGRFAPVGRVDLNMTLEKPTPPETPGMQVSADFYNMTLTPEAFRLTVSDVSGSLEIEDASIEFYDIRGSHGPSQIVAAGFLNLDQSPPLQMAEIQSWGLSLNEDFVRAAPKPLRETLEDWNVDGPIQVDAVLQSNAGDVDRHLRINAQVRLYDNAVKHRFFPMPFENVTGKIRFENTTVECEDLLATYNGAPVSATINADRNVGRMKIAARNVKLDESIRDFLPPSTRVAWNDRKPEGIVDLEIERLDYRKLDNGATEWIIEGDVGTADMSLVGSPAVLKIQGQSSFKGALRDELGGTALSGNMSLQQAEMFGWKFEDIDSQWLFARLNEGTGQFSLGEIQANAYDGPVNGKIDVTFDGQNSQYALTAAAHGLDAGRLIHKDDPVNRVMQGRADAYLYLSGNNGDRQSRRGGGHFEIRDGYLYELPIVVAILNVINLTVPREEAIRDARADFFVVGDRIEFDDIMLRGEGVALRGNGDMQLPSKLLDIRMISVSPHEWMRVPGLSNVVESASRRIVEIAIVGPLKNPSVKPRPFGGLRDEFSELFKRKPPRKTRPGK